MVCTLQEEWQVMHCRKNRRVSLFRMVSGDLDRTVKNQVSQVFLPAGVAGDVLLDVPPQHVLYVLLLEATWRMTTSRSPVLDSRHCTFHDELVAAVDGSAGSQLREEEGQQVLEQVM